MRSSVLPRKGSVVPDCPCLCIKQAVESFPSANCCLACSSTARVSTPSSERFAFFCLNNSTVLLSNPTAFADPSGPVLWRAGVSPLAVVDLWLSTWREDGGCPGVIARPGETAPSLFLESLSPALADPVEAVFWRAGALSLAVVDSWMLNWGGVGGRPSVIVCLESTAPSLFLGRTCPSQCSGYL